MAKHAIGLTESALQRCLRVANLVQKAKAGRGSSRKRIRESVPAKEQVCGIRAPALPMLMSCEDTSIVGQRNESPTDSHQAGSQVDSQPQIAPQGQIPSPTRPSTANAPQSARQPRVRRKIEYVPLAREVDTYGGRDVDFINGELTKVTARRPQRPVDEWGTVDIDGLTMSLRSRLPTELSYALTVLSVLSTMRGQSPDTGFSLQQCDDLLDELLDLLAEQAFADVDDVYNEAETFWTHRELVGFVHDQELQTFSDVPRTKGLLAPGGGPKPSAADIVSAILNLFRNFSLTGENQRFMGQRPDVLGLLLRICSLSGSGPSKSTQGNAPSPASPALSLPDVVKARRDVLTIISNLVPFTNLASHTARIRTSLFELLASFLVEPHDLSSPSGVVIQSSASNAGNVRPPLVVDLALEAFSKLAQPDTNRLALSRGIKLPWLWSLFSSLVHRLPVSSEDFAITMRMHDTWLSYIEKVVLSIYSICFLASPELKTKIKTDRTLAFPKLILRMVKRFVSINHPDARQYFLVSSRRAVEALKLIDEGGDAFESPQSSGPMFAFGMGFGESDAKQAETGIGLLAGFQDDVTWSIMMMPHLDDVMFAELDSLSRIAV
jgi:SWI/SNF chromatin-remodeling complex subunit SWI1